MRIHTIGYQHATQAEVLAALTAAGVRQLIDVRALPLSRRPGFSKTALAAACREAQIDYHHLRALGTPPEGRAAARVGRLDELARVYADQLALPEALAAAAQMLALAAEVPSALLCFCAQAAKCHRSLLLAAVAPGAEVVHLTPGEG